MSWLVNVKGFRRLGWLTLALSLMAALVAGTRSEERRVGKEC
jgi:hypothetical protein